MVAIARMSIWSFIGYFLGYIITHMTIGLLIKNKQEELDNTPGDINLPITITKLQLLFKWYPAIYVLFLLIVFYFL